MRLRLLTAILLAFAALSGRAAYYEENFDSADCLSTWTMTTTNASRTWRLAEGIGYGKTFTPIDPANRYSLCISYSDDRQDETATTPVIHIEPGAVLEYYNYFSPVWLFSASLDVYATDVATGDTIQLFGQFLWAQTTCYDETKWKLFRFPLDRLAGRDATISFRYHGSGGDDQMIDRLRVIDAAEATGEERSQPDAQIGMPEDGYLSPFAACFIPTGVEVQFHDLSTHQPTAWHWQFPGGTPAESQEPNPRVRYDSKALYSLALTASNQYGEDTDIMQYALQVGGAQYVWNITPEESQQIGRVSLANFGNYAGTNTLGLTAFAEHYKAPLRPATIDSLDIYFEAATVKTPGQVLTVRVQMADADGAPGPVLAEASITAADIQISSTEYLPTRFQLDRTAEIATDFFITVTGFPSGAGDDIAIACVRRPDGQTGTTWQYVLDEATDGTYLTTGQWWANTDSPVSMAVCPVITYDKPQTDNIKTVKTTRSTSGRRIYNLAGQRVAKARKGNIYIIKE